MSVRCFSLKIKCSKYNCWSRLVLMPKLLYLKPRAPGLYLARYYPDGSDDWGLGCLGCRWLRKAGPGSKLRLCWWPTSTISPNNFILWAPPLLSSPHPHRRPNRPDSCTHHSQLQISKSRLDPHYNRLGTVTLEFQPVTQSTPGNCL